ncbi:MAG TPA: type II toxin-antitoxin system VapC family toxin [Acidimicrobiales bacterium]|nr:type II toxin-antitoxin system VapC family toxin [Acidimicrobiales bacterium]
MTGPRPRLVVDGSVLVALVADGGDAAAWADRQVAGKSLVAPHLAVFEAANVLRRQAQAGRLDPTVAALAHADLLALPIQLWPYEPLADRCWALRQNLTAYDAAYVALAELLGATLVTLDRRLAAAPGPRCPVLAPVPA